MVFHFENKIRVKANRDELFSVYRDELENNVECLQFVSDIDLVDYEDNDESVHIVRIWTPDIKMIPSAIRAYGIAFKYKDDALWNNETKSVQFRITPHPYLTSMYEIQGATQFIYVSDVETEIRNRIQVDLSCGFVVSQRIEELFAQLITNAMQQTTEDLIKYCLSK